MNIRNMNSKTISFFPGWRDVKTMKKKFLKMKYRYSLKYWQVPRSARDKSFLSILKHQRFRFKDPFLLFLIPTVKRIVVLSLIKLGDSYKISFRSCISKLKGSRKLRPVPPFPSTRNIPYILSWDRF